MVGSVESGVLKPEFHFDLGSPNSHLAGLVIPDVEKRTGVAFDYVPMLLGGIYKATGNKSPTEILLGTKNKHEYAALETQRFLRRHQVHNFVRNPFIPVNALGRLR